MAIDEESQSSNFSQNLSVSLGGYQPKEGRAIDSCIELGYAVQPFNYLAIVANIGYLQTENIVSFKAVTYDYLTMIVSATGSIKAFYPFGLGNIYAIAGGGGYYSTFRLNGDHANKNNADLIMPTSESDFSLGYFYGIGGDYYIKQNVTLGIETKWLELHPSFNRLNNTTLQSLSERNLSGIQSSLKLTYIY
jgi:opacity protein-like surface antigen